MDWRPNDTRSAGTRRLRWPIPCYRATGWLPHWPIFRNGAAAQLRLLLIEHRIAFGEYPAETEDRDVPDIILQRAEMHARQAHFSGSSDAVSASWPFDLFRYRRLSDDAPDRYAEFNEPLGSYAVDAQGALALLTDQRTYPLPTK